MAEAKDEQEKRKRKGKSILEESELIGSSSSSDEGEDGVGRKGKKWKRESAISSVSREVDAPPLLGDPLAAAGFDIMTMILARLDARSVARSLLVSRGWHGVASSDRLWTSKVLFVVPSAQGSRLQQNLGRGCRMVALQPHCEELWLGKAHIPRSSQVCGLSKLAAYSLSVMDGKRMRIMKEDLWDHAWEFHFNEAAPEYWRNLDPYWKGTGPPMHRYFHPDGSQTADPGDEVWGGHESCYSIVTSFEGQGKIREHYVRINRWPRMHVSRKPDWGWEMSNNLYCYVSVPDAYKKGGTGPLFPFP